MKFIYKFISVYYALIRVTYKVQLCLTAICVVVAVCCCHCHWHCIIRLNNVVTRAACLPACLQRPPSPPLLLPLKGNVNICVFVCRILIAAVFGTRNK